MRAVGEFGVTSTQLAEQRSQNSALRNGRGTENEWDRQPVKDCRVLLSISLKVIEVYGKPVIDIFHKDFKIKVHV